MREERVAHAMKRTEGRGYFIACYSKNIHSAMKKGGAQAPKPPSLNCSLSAMCFCTFVCILAIASVCILEVYLLCLSVRKCSVPVVP